MEVDLDSAQLQEIAACTCASPKSASSRKAANLPLNRVSLNLPGLANFGPDLSCTVIASLLACAVCCRMESQSL